MGAFMAEHKEKREEAVRQSKKIMAEDLKIAKKEKELGAKRKKLECLETKVIFDCVIGKLRVHRNYRIIQTASFLELLRIEMTA